MSQTPTSSFFKHDEGERGGRDVNPEKKDTLLGGVGDCENHDHHCHRHCYRHHHHHDQYYHHCHHHHRPHHHYHHHPYHHHYHHPHHHYHHHHHFLTFVSNEVSLFQSVLKKIIGKRSDIASAQVDLRKRFDLSEQPSHVIRVEMKRALCRLRRRTTFLFVVFI